MSVDRGELKRLAEAAEKWELQDIYHPDRTAYILAASPSVVLELLRENKALKARLEVSNHAANLASETIKLLTTDIEILEDALARESEREAVVTPEWRRIRDYD